MRGRIDAIHRGGASTLGAIARELEARGVLTPGGRVRWHRVQVARMLAAIRAAERRAERKIRDGRGARPGFRLADPCDSCDSCDSWDDYWPSYR